MTHLLLVAALLSANLRPDVAESLAAVRAVGAEGKNNPEAAKAWATLCAAGPADVPALLKGLNGAGPIAANWIRSAIDKVVESAAASKAALPLEAIEGYFKDRTNDSRGRRLAFEIVKNAEPARAAALVPGLLDDPSVELRRDAVQQIIDKAEVDFKAKRKPEAKAAFLAALAAGRDQDQIDKAAGRLLELGEKVDLAKHFGFILDWRVIGPFDSTDTKGFDAPYPPESTIALSDEYDGKEKGKKVAWKKIESKDQYGEVDLNKSIGKHKFAAAYAYTEFTSDKDQDVEIRLGSITSWKLWVNEKLAFSQNEYHKGINLDQYRVNVKLQKGTNRLLLKICQNNQTEPWAQDWKFLLRVCDPTGTAILSTTRPPIVTEYKPGKRDY